MIDLMAHTVPGPAILKGGDQTFMNKYEVTVFAVGDDEVETKLGVARVAALSVLDAQRLAMDTLWDSRLDGASCRARYVCKQLGANVESSDV